MGNTVDKISAKLNEEANKTYYIQYIPHILRNPSINDRTIFEQFKHFFVKQEIRKLLDDDYQTKETPFQISTNISTRVPLFGKFYKKNDVNHFGGALRYFYHPVFIEGKLDTFEEKKFKIHATVGYMLTSTSMAFISGIRDARLRGRTLSSGSYGITKKDEIEGGLIIQHKNHLFGFQTKNLKNANIWCTYRDNTNSGVKVDVNMDRNSLIPSSCTASIYKQQWTGEKGEFSISIENGFQNIKASFYNKYRLDRTSIINYINIDPNTLNRIFLEVGSEFTLRQGMHFSQNAYGLAISSSNHLLKIKIDENGTSGVYKFKSMTEPNICVSLNGNWKGTNPKFGIGITIDK